jgi:DNA-binding response OmpR family regulator
MDGEQTGRLLLVEDENLLRSLTAHFLRSVGYDVVEAADGFEGIEYYLSFGPFDLVLLDLNLPLMSGVDVCRRIKLQDAAQPVIICSGAILDDHIRVLRELNVDVFLSKPYHPADLLKQVACTISSDSLVKCGPLV